MYRLSILSCRREEQTIRGACILEGFIYGVVLAVLLYTLGVA